MMMLLLLLNGERFVSYHVCFTSCENLWSRKSLPFTCSACTMRRMYGNRKNAVHLPPLPLFHSIPNTPYNTDTDAFFGIYFGLDNRSASDSHFTFHTELLGIMFEAK